MTGQECWSVGPRGVSLRVKAKPGSRKDAVIGPRGGELVVEVRAPAERGRANDELTKLLAKTLGVPKVSVVLKIGAGSHHKVFLLPVDAVAAVQRICGKVG